MLLDKRSRAKTAIFLRRNYNATLKAASQLTGGAHQAAVLLAVRCKRLQLLPGQVVTELGPNTHSEQGKQRRQHLHDSAAFDSAAPFTPHGCRHPTLRKKACLTLSLCAGTVAA